MKKPKNDPPWLTVAEAAARLKVSPARIHQLINEGQLQFTKEWGRTFVGSNSTSTLAVKRVLRDTRKRMKAKYGKSYRPIPTGEPRSAA